MNQQHKDYYYAIPNSITYTYYLDDEVTDSSDYRELLQMLQNAGEDDLVRIVISNYGGSLSTCIAIVNGLRACRATTVGVLTSVAYSAAGAIWLACEVQEVHNHVGFMGHDGQGGTFGSMFQQKQHIEHTMSILRSLYEDVYEHFLTKDEIETVLRNSDLWLTEKEIIERLEKRAELFKQQTEQRNKEAMNDLFGDEEIIPDEVLNKLTKAQLIQYMKGEIGIKYEEVDGKYTFTVNKIEDLDN
jgi:ATP-dependent protease ClpP protease subunit